MGDRYDWLNDERIPADVRAKLQKISDGPTYTSGTGALIDRLLRAEYALDEIAGYTDDQLVRDIATKARDQLRAGSPGPRLPMLAELAATEDRRTVLVGLVDGRVGVLHGIEGQPPWAPEDFVQPRAVAVDGARLRVRMLKPLRMARFLTAGPEALGPSWDEYTVELRDLVMRLANRAALRIRVGYDAVRRSWLIGPPARVIEPELQDVIDAEDVEARWESEVARFDLDGYQRSALAGILARAYRAGLEAGWRGILRREVAE